MKNYDGMNNIKQLIEKYLKLILIPAIVFLVLALGFYYLLDYFVGIDNLSNEALTLFVIAIPIFSWAVLTSIAGYKLHHKKN